MKKKQRRVRARKIRRIFRHQGVSGLLDWFKAPARDIIKLRRARSIERFCNRRRRKSKPGSARRKWWAERRLNWHKRVARYEANIADRNQPFKIIPREKWDNNPSDRQAARMANEGEGLFVHHSVSGSPVTQAGEEAEMRNLEAIARSRGFSDISYSFIVAPSGRIYEGRGRGIVGAHTVGFNSTAHAVSAMGNYETQKPTDAMVQSIKWLRDDYLRAVKFRPHSSVYATACPGQHLYRELFA